MAPKNGRGKSKGERKKKEEKILPVVMDVTVNLPDETSILLKVGFQGFKAKPNMGISTDRILDVRKLLSVNTVTCNVTNFSLSHEVRGPRVKDTVDVAALKPCTLTLVEEEYDKESAAAHIRRLLDIVACTTSFGPSKPDDAKSGRGAQDKAKKSGAGKQYPATASEESTGKSNATSSSKDDASMMVDGEGETNNACPKLGSFYEFFSLSHLSPPLQFIRRASKQPDDHVLEVDHLFLLDVKLCNGKLVLVEACKRGFIRLGKHRILSHNLVELLRQLSRAFDNAYDDLMKAFLDRNKFGNLPYGFRANTWLIPPAAGQLPSIFPPLPTEDETWGGNGGGWGRDGKFDLIPWANDFQYVASMPCQTPEERQIRDGKAFLIHSLFVDVAIFRAISTLRNVMGKLNLTDKVAHGEIVHDEKVGDLHITVMKDVSIASCKIDTKIDGLRATGLDQKTLTERNLLKGITADENTAAHDISSLGLVNLRYGAYIVAVKVEAKEHVSVDSLSPMIESFDQPEGGANALNINSLRLLLHKGAASDNQQPVKLSEFTESQRLNASRTFVEKLLEESLTKLQEEHVKQDNFVRWELGACWIQHLQDQKNTDKDKKPSVQKKKDEMKVQGLGTPLRSLKNKKQQEFSQLPTDNSMLSSNGSEHELPSTETQPGISLSDNELELKRILSDAAFTRLKESDTGLHQKVAFVKHLKELVDLSQIYYDEVALPKLVKLSEKLSHVQNLCIHEMVVRAYKHILRAVIASVGTDDVAVTVASALNLMLGVPETDNSEQSCNVHSLVQRWLELFMRRRYDWDITGFNFGELRKFAILRGLCQKVGVELVPRDYDMNSATPFHKTDIIALIPVHKIIIAQQATIYQQKALDINERELGLDHPDTMKSYGDLAVFYYRLQHTELALKYVKRALYLLHLTCGPSHPNTAATYINVAMMEEGLGNVHVALRYLHKALKCNKKLLGPDHIQTAASYHAIAIALSLMEAYPLSVQHEQTTLQILKAKLGPDDLRTQDAAAWLEYFESKAFEQQEAARNGTRKPDASIASKGHLSVSDLLDYINPSPDTKGRNSVATKRKSYLIKALQVLCTPHTMLTASNVQVQVKANHSSSRSSSEGSPRDTPTGSAPEVKIDEPVGSVTEAAEPDVPSDKPKLSVILKPVMPVEPTHEEPRITSSKVSSETNVEGEDGWQPVQRPRSAGGRAWRVRPRRTTIGKVYGYQKKEAVVETDHGRLNNSLQNTCHYVLKKRTLSPGSYTEEHTAKNASQVSKFGRRIVKAVTYRVKSVPSIANDEPREVTSREVEASQRQEKISLVKLGKSPSYKDVALAPPGTIAKLHASICHSDRQSETEVGVEKYEDAAGGDLREKVGSGNMEVEVDNVKDINECCPPAFKESVPAQRDTEEDRTDFIARTGDTPMMAAPTLESADSDTIDIHEVVPESKSVSIGMNPMYSSKGENFEAVAACGSEPERNSIALSQIEEHLVDKPMVTNSSDARDFPSKKLSASAAPFKPSPVNVRAAPMSLNMNLPSGPGAVQAVSPWPMNMTLHPGSPPVLPTVNPMYSSPHHAYPSPPATPNIIQAAPFMFPPYSQAPPVPPSSFPVTSNHFHPQHYTWQCNMSHNTPDFIPSTVWPGCRPVEFSVILPVPEPISEPMLEQKAQPPCSESSPGLPSLPDDISSGAEAKKDVVFSMPENVNNADKLSWIGLDKEKLENETISFEESKDSTPLYGDNSKKNSGSIGEITRSNHQDDDERTLSILVRGKRNRKHTLRVPLSLLRKPYYSQSFKVAYSRVVRDSETSKSVPLSSCESDVAA
ncbi:hypothetical protein Cgig2_031070 [Carnegiea gigantea]|uniref:Clu domain-containing protein n=1 Tax=Carnegiea gigantea TaxID=171969 RepID=A0A9Q1QFP1_9CARY|nr:hypothetical protein Cgig2_031070 [Carnegiea gigantea]